EECAEIEDRRHVQPNYGPKCGACAEEFPSKVEQQQARSCAKKRAEKADSELVRAKQHRAGANCECNTGSFAEVGRRQSLRPHPIMRFIELEIGRCQQSESQRCECDDKKPDGPLGFHDKGGSSLGWRAANSGSRDETNFSQINSERPRTSSVSPAARKKVAKTSLGQCAPR